MTSAEATNLDLPSGRVVRMDVLYEDGTEVSTYYLVDGPTWILLQCQTTGEPPKDRWRSIAESFEFLPEERSRRCAAHD